MRNIKLFGYDPLYAWGCSECDWFVLDANADPDNPPSEAAYLAFLEHKCEEHNRRPDDVAQTPGN